MPDDEGRGPGPIRGPIGPLGPEPHPIKPIPPIIPVNPVKPVNPLPSEPPKPVTVLRTSDMLLVRFTFANLRWVQAGKRLGLAPGFPTRPAYLIADFPPQHLIEEAFAEKTEDHDDVLSQKQHAPQLPDGSTVDPPPQNSSKTPAAPPIEASLSAHSRVVVKVAGTIPWSLDGFLDALRRLPLNIAPHAEDPFHVWTPLDHHSITSAVQTAVVKNLISGKGYSVSGIVRAAGRSVATARILEHRLGSQASSRVSAASRFAVDLGIGAQHLQKPPAPQKKPPAPPRPPLPEETAIELPWRLLLSPSQHGGFTHSNTPVTHDERTELWHSRLGYSTADGVDDSVGATVRAIWARDILGPLAPSDFTATGDQDVPAFTKSLTSYDRRMLVHETSNFNLIRQHKPWIPPFVSVDRLMLTALGGWLSSEFNAPTLPDLYKEKENDPGISFSVTEWKHRATMGRDHEVKVVYAGFLFPFGHAASLIKVTERKIAVPTGTEDDPFTGTPGRYAYLRQRFFIVGRQQTVEYDAATAPAWSDSRDYIAEPDRGAKRLDLAMPFSSVSILTRVTPDLDPPGQEITIEGDSGEFCFFPSVDGVAFPFKILATDREGQIVEYGGPLMFIERGRNATPDRLDRVTETYWKAGESKRRHDLHGQRVAYAPANVPGHPPLDTTLATESLHFDAAVLDATAIAKAKLTEDQPRFWPVLRTTDVVSPAMSALAGVSTPIAMKQPLTYLSNGFDPNANPHHVFLGVADESNKPAMSFERQADRSGGFVSPSLAVVGLSGSKGPVGGETIEQTMKTSTVDPTKFFGGVSARLFGAVSLAELLPALDAKTLPSFVAGSVNQVTGFLDDVQRLAGLSVDVGAAKSAAQAVLDAFTKLSEPNGVLTASTAIGTLDQSLGSASTLIAATDISTAVRVEASGILRRLGEYVGSAAEIVKVADRMRGGFSPPETVNARLAWSTPLQAWPNEQAAVFLPRGSKQLDLHVEIQAPTGPGKEPTTTVACSLPPFTLGLIGADPFISLVVERMEFTVVAGRKPDVNVVMADEGVVFGGPLSFVKTLSEIIPSDGFSDPPYLDVTAQGITAGFDLSIPDLSVGVLSLCNISLGAKALVPFIGDSLDFTFSFCTRENPFRLTVWLFGGGGFFAITVTPERCRMLEASFEFGAAVALDFGVASGSIECMAGIYFKLELGSDGHDDSELAGYFRMRGEVDVLGLISASIELYLELKYEPSSGKATGKASLSIEVEVLFLSMSVEITCEKKFTGSNADPKFAEILGRQSPAGTRAWDDYCNAFAAG